MLWATAGYSWLTYRYLMSVISPYVVQQYYCCNVISFVGNNTDLLWESQVYKIQRYIVDNWHHSIFGDKWCMHRVCGQVTKLVSFPSLKHSYIRYIVKRRALVHSIMTYLTLFASLFTTLGLLDGIMQLVVPAIAYHSYGNVNTQIDPCVSIPPPFTANKSPYKSLNLFKPTLTSPWTLCTHLHTFNGYTQARCVTMKSFSLLIGQHLWKMRSFHVALHVISF